MKAKRTFLITMVIGLCATALLGISTILMDQYSSTQGQIIGTSLTIAMFSLTSLLATVVWERNIWRWPMALAMLISGFGLLVYLFMIWFESLVGTYDDVGYRLMAVIAVWAIGLPHAGLLSLTQLSGVWRWIRRCCLSVIFLLATVISAAVIFELDDDVVAQLIGVLVILAALGTITLPILGRVHKIDKLAAVESTTLDIQITCPRCRASQTVSNGHSRCVKCALKFHIEIEEPRCPKCQYLLHKLTSDRCPECGTQLHGDDVAGQPHPSAT